MNEKQIERINKEKRNIPTEFLWKKQGIGNYLAENVKPSWNLIINGSGKNRKSALFHRIIQVYIDKGLSNRPIVIISSDRNLLDTIEQMIFDKSVHRNRPFVKICNENALYNVNFLCELH